MPYVIGLVAYSLNLLLEVKIFESKMTAWDDGEESQDETLLALLLELVSFRRSNVKKNEDKERGQCDNPVEEEKEESGDLNRKKRRQQIVNV